MTKKVIAIISVLKPVDDTRNYEKVARSLGNTNKYDINIIGFSTKNNPLSPNIGFHPIFYFKRTSIKRLTASIKIYKLLLKLKPELIIVTTPELLVVSIVNRIIFGTRIIYDVQENYFRNIVYTSTFPILLRSPIALIVRGIEYVSHWFIDCFFLAEKVYSEQMKYLVSRSVVIENKALIPNNRDCIKHKDHKNMTFVYSGTIATHYGIFDAIEFVKRLNARINNVSLTIIGFAAQEKTYHKLIRIVEDNDFIKLIGGDTLVAHDQILNEMYQADFCLLPYQENKSTSGRIPTKLFECLAMEKPVIITPNMAWDAIINQNNAGIIHDFKTISESFISKLNDHYYGKNMSSMHTWDNSEEVLLQAVSELI